MDELKLSVNQRRALPIFLKPGLTRDLCKEANIDPTTYYTWCKQKLWKKTLEDHSKQAAQEARGYIKALYTLAAEKLQKLLNSQSEAIALKAVCVILEYQFKYQEQDEIITRVDEVEAKLNAIAQPEKVPIKVGRGRRKVVSEQPPES